jgi:hypothetical protein
MFNDIIPFNITLVIKLYLNPSKLHTLSSCFIISSLDDNSSFILDIFLLLKLYLFNIGKMVSEWAAETLWEECPELQEKFPTLNDFDNYLATLTDDELENYADKYDNLDIWDARPFYDGYFVSVKDDVEQTPVLERAIRAIHSFDSLFEHDVFEC